MLTLPWNKALDNSYLFSKMSEQVLWYNGFAKSPVIPESLKPYTVGTKFISTKQVPSSLILRRAGSASVRINRDLLLKAGFTLSEQQPGQTEVRDLVAKNTVGDHPTYSSSLASLLTESAKLNDYVHQGTGELVDTDLEHVSAHGSVTPMAEHFDELPGETIRYRKSTSYRIRYDDPWKIHAGHRLGDIKGLNPDVIVWSGDVIRLQDPLPPRLFGPKWENQKSKNKLRFSDIVNHEVKLHVIYEHTHWGFRLRGLCNEPGPLQAWARKLRTRINRFLSGGMDPLMSKEARSELFVHHKAERRARSLRFIELLKTVDGIFTQRYLCYPEEVWTWDRFDLFTLGNIDALIGDEFLDGEMTEKAITIRTAYAELKAARKWFKNHSHSGDLEQALVDCTDVPHWCKQFVNVWKRTLTAEGPRKVYLIGILSQTRGCGTPPPLVLLQSKWKFLSTITTERPPETPTMRALRRAAMREVLKDLPASAFTGLATKARITVSTASSWEKTRREGGTIEAARELLESLPVGEQIPVRDLETGRIEYYRSIEDFDSVGEAVFWQSLDCVLRTPPSDLTVAYLTMVKEPGKARTVTKARTCLKIVLDLVNKLCSAPLEKGIRSSTSGMGKANHGWNLFCRLMSDELKDLVFSVDHRDENAYEGYVERTDTFKNLFVSSTDYQEATDQLDHTVAADLGRAWMAKCGIPKLLQALVYNTCYKPRTVFFRATGALKTFGQPRPDMGDDIRAVQLVRGVLMGDPLTKPVLHLINVVTRRLSRELYRPEFYLNFVNSEEAYEHFIRGVRKTSESRT